MTKIYRRSDILLMPSIREGVPNALIESIYFGLSCICTKLPSIENFLKYRNLKFIKVSSKKNIWCNELIKLLVKPTKKQINNTILLNFNNKKITENYLKLYKNL